MNGWLARVSAGLVCPGGEFPRSMRMRRRLSYDPAWHQTGNSVRKLSCFIASLSLAIIAGCAVSTYSDPRAGRAGSSDRDPGCADAVLVSTGGAAPREPNTLAIRWTGFANFELAF